MGFEQKAEMKMGTEYEPSPYRLELNKKWRQSIICINVSDTEEY